MKALHFFASYSSIAAATSFRSTVSPGLGISQLHYYSSTILSSLGTQLNVWKVFNAGISCTTSSSSKEEIDGKDTMGWYGDEGRHIRVSVWWDFENCGVPIGVNVYKVVPRILAALRASGIKGPITISGYGDIQQLSRSTQEALSATGICLSHIPRGGKNSADRALLVDLVLWTSHNPPPAHLFLISGDGDFSSILHRLRMKNYNILLANTHTSSAALCNAASIVWQWNRLVRGKGLLGKQFNHPPDGPPGSWYGQSSGPIEDVFRDIELQASTDTLPEISERFETESSPETDMKPRPIPKTVMTQIACVLNSHPQGLSIQQLQSEIVRREIDVDKDFFGHKKFLRFLLAMPNTLRLHRRASSDGKTWTYHAYAKSTESSKNKSRLSPMDGEKEQHKRLEQSETNAETLSSRDQHLDKQLPLSAWVKETQADASSEQSDSIQDKNSQLQNSFFGRVLRNWFGIGLSNGSGKVDDSNNGMIKTKSEDDDDRNGRVDGARADGWKLDAKNPGDPGKNSKLSKENKISSRQLLSKSPSCNSSSSDIGVRKELKQKLEGHLEKIEVNPSASPNIFYWFSQYWKGWLSDLRENFGQASLGDSDFVNSQKKSFADSQGTLGCESVTLIQSDYPRKFFKPEFWVEVKSYLQSIRGSVLISKAQSRRDVAKMLQKHGPFTVRHLRPSHLHHLVNILVDEKKWLKCSSETFLFKLNLPVKSDCTHPAFTDEMRSSTSAFCHAKAEAEVKSTSFTEELEMQDDKQQLDGNISDVNNAGRAIDTGRHPKFEELKDWLLKIIKGHGNISVANLQISFNKKFNSNLDCNFYGFATVEDLIAACSDEISVIVKENIAIVFNEKEGSKELSRREIVNNCQKLLDEVLHDNPDGYCISSFKSLYLQRYGYVLDQTMLGYAKLSSFLQAMPRVEVQSSIIYSTEKSHERVLGKEESTTVNLSNSIKEERRTTHMGSNTEETKSVYGDVAEEGKSTCEGAMINQEAVWEALGPVVVEGSEKYISSPDMSIQLNGSHDGLQTERQKDLEETTWQSREGSGHPDALGCDTERFRPLDNTTSVEGSSTLQIGETKSILQVLDAWHKDSDTFITPKQCNEKLDGLIDCSVYNNFLDSSKSVGESSRSRLSIKGFKNQMRHRKSRVFVHETSGASNNDAEESLVDSILSTLKKPTNVTLDKRIP